MIERRPPIRGLALKTCRISIVVAEGRHFDIPEPVIASSVEASNGARSRAPARAVEAMPPVGRVLVVSKPRTYLPAAILLARPGALRAVTGHGNRARVAARASNGDATTPVVHLSEHDTKLHCCPRALLDVARALKLRPCIVIGNTGRLDLACVCRGTVHRHLASTLLCSVEGYHCAAEVLRDLRAVLLLALALVVLPLVGLLRAIPRNDSVVRSRADDLVAVALQDLREIKGRAAAALLLSGAALFHAVALRWRPYDGILDAVHSDLAMVGGRTGQLDLASTTPGMLEVHGRATRVDGGSRAARLRERHVAIGLVALGSVAVLHDPALPLAVAVLAILGATWRSEVDGTAAVLVVLARLRALFTVLDGLATTLAALRVIERVEAHGREAVEIERGVAVEAFSATGRLSRLGHALVRVLGVDEEAMASFLSSNCAFVRGAPDTKVWTPALAGGIVLHNEVRRSPNALGIHLSRTIVEHEAVPLLTFRCARLRDLAREAIWASEHHLTRALQDLGEFELCFA